jgi:hypothetical protein
MKYTTQNKFLEEKIKDNLDKLKLLKNPINNNITKETITKKSNKIQPQTSRWKTPRNNNTLYNTLDNESLIASSLRNK